MKGARTAVLAAGVLLIAPVTAGCMAGIKAETSREVTTIDGSGASVGNLRLRNIYAPGPDSGASFPAGSTIPIYLTVVSLSATDATDQLTSASSPLGTVTVQPGNSSASPSATALPGATPSAASGGGPVAIPPGQAVDFKPGGPSLLLSGTTKPVAAASFIPVTLTFAQAGTVTVQVAVDNGYASGQPSNPVTGSETPSPEATATATPSPLPSAS